MYLPKVDPVSVGRMEAPAAQQMAAVEMAVVDPFLSANYQIP
jgi:hypothetical protein